MTANIESIFYIRQAHWHGLGVQLEDTLTSKNVLIISGLDWRVIQKGYIYFRKASK